MEGEGEGEGSALRAGLARYPHRVWQARCGLEWECEAAGRFTSSGSDGPAPLPVPHGPQELRQIISLHRGLRDCTSRGDI